jgi:hypothetical protein
MKITDCDIVYISYDEPDADQLFAKLKSISPRRPLRVHGVKGFDAAHKEAAKLAKTDRFIIVDGDNLVRPDFFKMSVDLIRQPSDVVYSYTALNSVNGLAYGNGGVKIWPRRLLLTVDTHEKGRGNDFCWTFRYWQVPDIVSDVQFAQSPYHAFRAGYREAVKLSQVKDKTLSDWPTTRKKLYPPNLSRLLVWTTVGTDVRNGDWAIYGARCGLAHLWLDKLDGDLIRDYDWFTARWQQLCGAKPKEMSILLGKKLERLLDIDLPNLTALASRWFKAVYLNPPRQGPMLAGMKPPIGP